MYLQRRRRKWYALHDIPQDVQKALGRVRFCQSLDTEDRSTAERRAAPLKVRWLGEIKQARTGNGDHIEQDAQFWRRLLKDTTDEDERDLIVEQIMSEGRDRAETAAAKAGFVDHREPGYEELPAVQESRRFVAVATGALVRFDEHLDEYIASLTNHEAKTVAMKQATIRKFCEGFQYIADVERKGVQRWVNQQVQQNGKKPATVRRDLGDIRGYWTYLQSVEAASDSVLPFEKLTLPKLGKAANGDTREPFEAADVVKLWKAAKAREDHQLADLIELAMWTGARIEELCALKVEKVGRDYFDVEDAKTAAGWRRVPIHSKLKKTVARLAKASTDSYLVSGLGVNKYGDRSGAIGKRFGTLKTSLGFQKDKHVFHSIRKTVATLLENAGVPEGVAADIIGHEKPNITYGLYSGGANMATKRKAIEKLRYPL
jgi:integrase